MFEAGPDPGGSGSDRGVSDDSADDFVVEAVTGDAHAPDREDPFPDGFGDDHEEPPVPVHPCLL